MPQFYPFVKTQSSILFKLTAFCILLLSTQQLLAQPTISSFVPASGTTGTTVTITGTNFSITPTNNAVYFGAVRATVTSATYTTLTVTVPVGATYQPIIVTTSGLTAYSARPFIVTYNSQPDFSAASFTRTDIPLGSLIWNPTYVAAADFDGDGKTELVTSFSDAIMVFRPGTDGTFEYTIAFTYTTGTGTNPRAISIGDIDGDGKPDIAFVQNSAQKLSILRNSSTPGNISFTGGVNYTTGMGPAGTAIRDLNGDGKPEIVVTVANTNSVSIYQNASTPGTISLSPALFLTCDANAAEIAIDDFDGDDKADIAIGNSYNTYIAVFRNTSASGILSFTPKTDYLLPGRPASLCSGDVDGDGKSELVIANSTVNSISVLRNTSTSGTISFAPKVDYATGATPTSVILSDLNGDGKTDLAVANSDQTTISVLKNNSTPGVITLATGIQFPTNGKPLKLCAADLNQDGKPDLVIPNSNLNTISAFKNNGINEPAIVSFTPMQGQTGTTVTINGSNFTGATAVSFGGIPAASFTVNSPSQITAVVGQGTAGKVAVTTSEGIGTASGFEFVPKITSFSPTKAVIGAPVTITGAGFSTIPTNNIVYFGAVKATVTAATTTSLSVVVPAGATYEPVSVTIAGVTAWSVQPFNTIFAGGGGNLTASSFAAKTDLAAGYDPMAVAISDLDGDGLPDLAAAVRYTGYVSLYRNASYNGSISFVSKVDITAASNTYSIAAGDFNGDGKPDLVTSNSLALTLTTFKNNSTRGNFSFGSAQLVSGYYTGNQSVFVKVADLDGDGKPDIVAGNYSPNNISIFRNTSTLANINFDMKIDYPVAASSKNLAIGDLDGDGKPDLAVATNGMVTIFKNNSTPGNISFTEAGNYFGTYGASVVCMADLDGDGRADLAVTNYDQFDNQKNNISIFPNTSSGGAISFGTKADFFIGSGSGSNGFSIADLNGDGKPDLAVINSGTYKVAVLKNTSSNGSISFNGNVDFASGTNPYNIALGDLNADGMPDMVAVNSWGNSSSLSVFKNTYKANPPKITSFNPTTAHSGEEITIKGTNFIPGTIVAFGNKNALSVTVTSDTTMTAVTGAGASGYVRISTEGGLDSLPGFTFIPANPVITSFSPTNAQRGATVVIKGNHFAGATAVYFGNTAAASFSITTDSTISAIVAQGTSGYVRIITPFGTDSLSGFTYTPVSPVISSFSPTAVRQGDLVTIKGTNFTGTTGVTLGGVSASFSVVSDTIISVIVGPGATGKVVVTGADGADSMSGFIYTGTTVDAFSPAVAGNGTIVTIKGTNLRNAWSVSFGGISATTFTILSDTSITATVATGATGAVKVITPQGSGSRNGFIFLPPPVINSFTPPVGDVGDTIRVNGKYFTYTDSVLYGGTPATSFRIINDTSLVAVLGNGNSGDVSVISVGGTGTKAGFAFKTAPIVTSYTPGAAPAGSTVSISGIRFGQTPADNIVYFGAVKATILTATSTNLTVQVPYGATYAPISVTTTGGTGYAAKEFVLTFKGGDTAFTQNSFAAKIDLAVVPGVSDGVITDIFEDGKPDLITAGVTPAIISMHKNTSPGGAISFDPKQDFAASLSIVQIAVSDLNADGKPDLSLGSESDLRIASVYQNTTTNGNVSLSQAIILNNNALSGHRVTSADIDNDGKPDVAAVGFYGGDVAIYRNTSTNNSVSFAPVYNYVNTIDKGTGICFSDIDMDGKLDLVISYGGSFSVYRNTGAKGVLSFAPGLNFSLTSGYSVYGGLVAGDIDGDGKPDIAATAGPFCIFRNTSMPGTISFEAKKTFATGAWPIDVSMGDLNGDGKPDLVVCNKDGKSVSVYKNSSTPGTISIEPKVDYVIGDSPKNTAIGDLDADGKPELVVFSGNMVSIFKNLMNFIPAPEIISFTPGSGYTGTTVTIKGHDLTNATNVSFGGTAAGSFTVVSDSIITAVVGTGATGVVQVTTPQGTDTLSGFNFIVPVPDITSFTPTSGANGALVTIKGNNFTGATNVSFGGTAAGSFTIVSDSVITATVGTGTSGVVQVVTPLGTDTLGGFTFIPPVLLPEIISFAPASGTTGTMITIIGNHFTGVTAITFGGTAAASFTIVSDSMITAIVGTGATGAVQVTTTVGTDTLSEFTYSTGNGQEITLAPNPATGFVFVNHPVVSGSSLIRLVDMLGNTVKNVNVNPNTSTTRLDITGVKQGTYTISWSDGADSFTKLLLIQ
jgi:hypothetical protein